MKIENNGILTIKLDRELITRLEKAEDIIGPERFHELVISTIHRADKRMMGIWEELTKSQRYFGSYFQTKKVPIITDSIEHTNMISNLHKEVDTAIKNEKVMATYHTELSKLATLIENGVLE